MTARLWAAPKVENWADMWDELRAVLRVESWAVMMADEMGDLKAVCSAPQKVGTSVVWTVLQMVGKTAALTDGLSAGQMVSNWEMQKAGLKDHLLVAKWVVSRAGWMAVKMVLRSAVSMVARSVSQSVVSKAAQRAEQMADWTEKPTVV